MKKSHMVVLVILAGGVTAYVAARLLTTERQRVARVVRRMIRRIERRDAAGFCLYLAEDYQDGNGHNRASVRSLLSRGLPLASSIRVTTTDLRVTVHDGDPPTATVEFDGEVVAHARGRPNLPPWRWRSPVRLRLRKRDGEWRVVEAEYRRPQWQYGTG